jgi:hypothetical protein
MKIVFSFILSIALLLLVQSGAQAQVRRVTPTTIPLQIGPIASDSADIATPSAEEQRKIDQIIKEDVTRPEEAERRVELFALFAQRPIEKITPLNFMAYGVQYAVRVAGVPANTIVLILLLPLLASLIAFMRHVIGLPGIGMLLPIALSITLIATGLLPGALLLGSIILASTVARFILKRIRIMQLPKMALSMFIVSVCILSILTLSAASGLLVVRQLSIFPVLLMILLSEQIVSVQLERTTRDIIHITVFTILLGVLGFLLLSSELLRNTILLYPELILFLIPLDIVIGRYFGLRVTEFFRFSEIRNHGSK